MSVDGGRKGVPESAEFVVLVSGAGRDLAGSRALASAIDGGRVVLWDVGSGVLERECLLASDVKTLPLCREIKR